MSLCFCIQINPYICRKYKNSRQYAYNTFIHGNRDAGTDCHRTDSLTLFGGKKIPELMKGLGKGVKNFKDGVNGIEEDLKADTKKEESNPSKEK